MNEDQPGPTTATELMALYKQIGDQLNEKLRQAATESLCDAMREYLKEGMQKMTEQFRDAAFDTSGYESGEGVRNGYLQRDAAADLSMCRRAAEDLAMCRLAKAEWVESSQFMDIGIVALPYWIERAQRAEQERDALRARVAELEPATEDKP